MLVRVGGALRLADDVLAAPPEAHKNRKLHENKAIVGVKFNDKLQRFERKL